jgi:hypothetical protein
VAVETETIRTSVVAVAVADTALVGTRNFLGAGQVQKPHLSFSHLSITLLLLALVVAVAVATVALVN